MSIIGIDIGTTGCKATLFENSGQVIASSYREYETIQLGDGRYELDPKVVWAYTRQVVSEVSRKAEDEVQGISVSSFGEAAVYMDDQDRILRNSILYMDSRGEEVLKTLVDELGRDYIKKATGLAAHKMYTLPKLMWVKAMEAKTYAQISKVMLYGDYISYKLSGKRFIDPALASRTMGFNITSREWDARLFEAADIDMSLFSQVAEIGRPMGAVRPEIAEELGLGARCQVIVGSHDQVCATIGASVFEKGQAMLGLGTVSCLTPVFKKEEIDLDRLDKYPGVPYLNAYETTYAFNFTCGSLLRWFRDEIAHREKARAAENGEDVYEILSEILPDKPTDLLVLPYFSGSGTPHMDPDARGLIYGLKFDSSRGMIYRSLMEGVAYEVRVNMERLEAAGMEIREIYGTGGGTNSDVWCQIISNVVKKPFKVLSVKESGTLGVYAIAAVSLGLYPDYREALQQQVAVEDEFLPNECSSVYEKQYQKYKRLYQASLAIEGGNHGIS